MPTNWTIWAKWVHFQKHTNFQNYQEESDLNRLITTNEIVAVIKTLSANESLRPDGFRRIVPYIHIGTMLSLLKLFKKIQEEGRLPISFKYA